jgi:RimJ/RimL family protein N-acetyltransferase
MLRLERFQRKHFGALKEWISGERLLAQWCGSLFSYPLDDAQLEAYLDAMKAGSDYGYMALDGRGCPVGHIRIGRLDKAAKTAVVMCVIIAPGKCGRGLGREMTALAVERAFTTLELETLVLNVFSFNTPAIRCYEALGFEQCEYKKESFDFRDEKWDKIKMRLDKKKWTEIRGESIVTDH